MRPLSWMPIGLAAYSGRQGVVLRVEVILAGFGRILDRLLVEAGTAGVGEDLSRPVVDRDEHAVVDVAAAETSAAGGAWADDPGVVVRVALGGDAECREVCDVIGRRGLVGAEYVRLEPLLGRALHIHVQRGYHPQAARVHLRALGGIDTRVAEQVRQLLPHQQVELGRNVCRAICRVEDHRLRLRQQESCVVVLALQQAVAVVLAHVFQDAVAPDHYRLVGGDDPCSVIPLVGVRQ